MNTNIISVILAISFTGQVTTILKFAGSSMIWQIVTKSPIAPMETPNPSITIWSKAANVAALIKLDYLNTILLWLDGVVPKSGSGWKAVIGFNTVCVPSLTPKVSEANVQELLDPTQICLERKELEAIIQNPNIDMDLIMNTSERLGEIINLIDEKEMRWMELDEKQQ